VTELEIAGLLESFPREGADLASGVRWGDAEARLDAEGRLQIRIEPPSGVLILVRQTGGAGAAETIAGLARIHRLRAEAPNRRAAPGPGDLEGDYDFWFDGGACRLVTGVTLHEFADGSRTHQLVIPALELAVEFPDGRSVRVASFSPDRTPARMDGWAREEQSRRSGGE
jgi:hypothetical protein